MLSTADVGLSPDPKNPLNDVSTMNKTMEYMAFGLPVVAFDLKETRVSAGDAALYVPSGDIAAYARAIVELSGRRRRPGERMGEIGRQRIEQRARRGRTSGTRVRRASTTGSGRESANVDRAES